MTKFLPKTSLLPAARLDQIRRELEQRPPQSLLDEIRQQNQVLLSVLDEVRNRQEELACLNTELEDTNRGVVALYAELDEKADHLRRADEMKSRFLSNMSHEFRTPVNSIMALARILLDRADGDLTPEQEKQVGFIRKAASDLSELVNDLLDLAKVEAGKIVVYPQEFTVGDLFGALRGMLKPLLVTQSVSLVFEDASALPALYTDEGKVSQILRNFVSNALKFTEKGEVRVTAELRAAGDAIVFSVQDTGIGISPEHQELIFREFTQITGRHQKCVKGTGLGLPLSRKLAELLGGSVALQSKLGDGSTFSVTVPLVYRTISKVPHAEVEFERDPFRIPVLVVEDAPETLLIYQKFLQSTPFQMIPACTIREARAALKKVNPRAVVLDLRLEGEDAWSLLKELKENPDTEHIPVLVVSNLDEARRSIGMGAETFCAKPVERLWLLENLQCLVATNVLRYALVIDDEESSRYLLVEILREMNCSTMEAISGVEGLRIARDDRPQVILLDLTMPGMSGFDVLAELKRDPITSGIPVIIATGKMLDDVERRQLASGAVAILAKGLSSRADVVTALRHALLNAGLRPATALEPILMQR